MKLLRTVVLLLTGLLTGMAQAEDAWVSYKAEDCNFEVKLPGEAIKAKAAVNGPYGKADFRQHVLKDKSGVFSISCMKHPKGKLSKTASEKVISQMVDPMLKQLGATEVKSEKITLGKLEGRQIQFKVPRRSRFMAARYFVTDDTIYRVNFESEKYENSKKTLEKYFNSFSLKKDVG